MNAKISVFVICVEAIIYLLLYNLHNSTFSLKASIQDMLSKKSTCLLVKVKNLKDLQQRPGTSPEKYYLSHGAECNITIIIVFHIFRLTIKYQNRVKYF